MNEQLSILWKTYKDKFTKEGAKDIVDILERGYCYCYDNPMNEILITGFNPAYDKKTNESFGFVFRDSDEKKGYFRELKRMIGPLLNQTAYLDLFPIKVTIQEHFSETFERDNTTLSFLSECLRISQKEIERISPKLIIVNNKDGKGFWGANPDCVWMGYKFDKYPTEQILQKDIDAYRIIGLKDDPKDERVLKLNETSLLNSIIVFYALYDDRHKDRYAHKMLDPMDIDVLYQKALEK